MNIYTYIYIYTEREKLAYVVMFLSSQIYLISLLMFSDKNKLWNCGFCCSHTREHESCSLFSEVRRWVWATLLSVYQNTRCILQFACFSNLTLPTPPLVNYSRTTSVSSSLRATRTGAQV